MTARFAVDESLIEEARQVGRHETRDEAVRCALEEYVTRHKRMRIVELFGTVEYEEDYDYKALRRKERP